MIVINLLPGKGLFWKTVLIVSLCLLLLGLLMQLILLLENQRLAQKLALLHEDVQEGGNHASTAWALESKKNELSQLPKEIDNLKKELATLESQITLLERNPSSDRWIDTLPFLADNLPKTIWFTKVETSQDLTLLLEGKGIDYNEILHWLNTFQQMIPWHNKSRVRYLQMQQGVQFGIEVWMDGETL